VINVSRKNFDHFTQLAVIGLRDIEQMSLQPASKTRTATRQSWMSWGSLLQTEAAATTKARSPMKNVG